MTTEDLTPAVWRYLERLQKETLPPGVERDGVRFLARGEYSDEGSAEELRGLGRPIADYLAEILARCISKYGGEAEGGRKKVPWDISCVAVLADPGAVTIEPLAVPTLDAAGAHDFLQRGRTVEALVDLDPGRVAAATRRAPALAGVKPFVRDR